jgi:hypothetical protein
VPNAANKLAAALTGWLLHSRLRARAKAHRGHRMVVALVLDFDNFVLQAHRSSNDRRSAICRRQPDSCDRRGVAAAAVVPHRPLALRQVQRGSSQNDPVFAVSDHHVIGVAASISTESKRPGPIPSSVAREDANKITNRRFANV